MPRSFIHENGLDAGLLSQEKLPTQAPVIYSAGVTEFFWANGMHGESPKIQPSQADSRSVSKTEGSFFRHFDT